MTIFIYARKRDALSTTYLVEATVKEYIELARKKRRCGYKLGVFGARDLETICRVYIEYAPFKKVSSIEELIVFMEGVRDARYK